MSIPPNLRDTWSKVQRMAQNPGRGGPGGAPKGTAGGIAAIVLLGGALVIGNNALFNVDGGHRAIKYTRIGGVRQEIFSEGIYFILVTFCTTY